MMAKGKNSLAKRRANTENALERQDDESREQYHQRIKRCAKAHRLGISHGIYHAQLMATTNSDSPEVLESSFYAAAQARLDLDPKDSAESMLIEQMLLLHGRFLHLTMLAHQQKGIKQIQVINDAADRCANQYRRAVQTLSDYRNPRKVVFNKIDQQNNAEQQVVQNGNPNENATIKQGSSPATPPALPADSGRPAVPSIIDLQC